jgi:hypothetical protein
MARGGLRDGAGRPKGSKSQSTRTKEMAREALRDMVIAEIEPLVAAQISQAKGVNYLVVREASTGKFLRVAGPKERIKKGEEIIEVWHKPPSIAAFTDLMNRTLDKPKEQVIEMNVAVDWEKRIARMKAARRRAGDMKEARARVGDK